MTSGYEATADGKTINFVKETPGATVAKITGLGKNLKVSTGSEVTLDASENVVMGDDGEPVLVDAGKVGLITKKKIDGVNYNIFTQAIAIRDYGTRKGISLNENALGTTDIKLESDNYVFLEEGDSITKSTTTDPMFYSKNGTVTLKRTTTAGFTLDTDGKVYTYTKAGKSGGDVLATISGLSKELNFDNGMSASISTALLSMDDNNVITIKNGALNGAKVTVKSSDKNTSYAIELASDVATSAENATEWVAGSTATYKNYDRGYYTHASLKGGGVDS